MSAVCCVCELPLDEPALAAGDLHVECAMQRVAEDAVIALAGAVVLVLAPLVIVWAG
jgi:hypothetical protein